MIARRFYGVIRVAHRNNCKSFQNTKCIGKETNMYIFLFIEYILNSGFIVFGFFTDLWFE